jgi:Transcriptional regulator PadR-like family
VTLRAGTLYGALERLDADGLIGVDREEVVDRRLRRYYRLTDVLQVAIPYWESQGAWENRIRSAKAAIPAGVALPPELLGRFHDDGIQFLSQPSFLILAGGHVIVAAAVLAGLRRSSCLRHSRWRWPIPWQRVAWRPGAWPGPCAGA